MFCPVCECEYRKGIEVCATCEVKLVPHLSARGAHVPFREAPVASEGPEDALVAHCGFIELDDARAARETLRAEGIRSDILIRYAAPVGPTGTAEEEYWLRVPASRRSAVDELLGEVDEIEDAGEEGGEGAVACSDCGKPVAEDENICPHCGAQFE